MNSTLWEIGRPSRTNRSRAVCPSARGTPVPPSGMPPIPEVLLSGHHANIADWRRAEAEGLIKERRFDQWRAYPEKSGADPEEDRSSRARVAYADEHRERTERAADESDRAIWGRASHRARPRNPDFKPGDTVRVGCKVTEGRGTRFETTRACASDAGAAKASARRPPSARIPSAGAWRGYSRCA